MSKAKAGKTATATCHGCGLTLSAANHSVAHVIPNALGGRLKLKNVLCRDCNTKLDEVADNALVEAFSAWPTLLGIARDRGANPAKLVGTKNGRRVRLEPDGSLTAMDVNYAVSSSIDGTEIDISAGNIKTFRQLLKRAKKEVPKLDVTLAETHARHLSLDDDDQLVMGFDFSPNAVFGGVVSAIWLYLIEKTGRAFLDWNRLLQVIRKMQTDGGTFRYLIGGLPGLKGPDISLGHKIIIRSVPSTGELIAYIEILGVLKVGGLFAKADGPTELIEQIYVYDLCSNAERSDEFVINPFEFEGQDWDSVGLGPTEAEGLREHFFGALETTFAKHYVARFASDPSA
ncbi:MAG: HNH endonuclease [Alphaproteobacteria bacterium]|nr:HNH endonuclease [Alphaproteobacteria bacterium]